MPQPEEFRQAVGRAIAYALATIQFRFDSAEDPRCRLDYHCVAHTQGVIARTRRILEIVEEHAPGTVGQDGIEIGALAAAWHDVVQEWYLHTEDDGCVVRKRMNGRNERNSFEQAAAALTSIDDRRELILAERLFTPHHRKLLFDGIMATEPQFSPAGLTQPYLSTRPSAVAFAVALADLGEPGVDVAEFLRSGDAVFREDCYSCTEATLVRNHFEVPEMARYLARMRTHAQKQVAFARSIRDRMSHYLSGFPEAARPAIAAHFSVFDDSIAAAEERATQRQQMLFSELLVDMGYEL